jgi:hypothetical protein
MTANPSTATAPARPKESHDGAQSLTRKTHPDPDYASRGIGHATVKRFPAPAAGDHLFAPRFPETAPGRRPEDHIQVDLADPRDTARAKEMRSRPS